jgi:hypothetical protein
VAYVSDGPQSDKWAWVLFEATLDIPANAEIVAKAVSEIHLSPLFHPTYQQCLFACLISHTFSAGQLCFSLVINQRIVFSAMTS